MVVRAGDGEYGLFMYVYGGNNIWQPVGEMLSVDEEVDTVDFGVPEYGLTGGFHIVIDTFIAHIDNDFSHCLPSFFRSTSSHDIES